MTEILVPETYTSGPPDVARYQDDVTEGVVMRFASLMALGEPVTNVDYEWALEYARTQSAHETQDWTNYCQKFCRSAYKVPALFGSAYAQWLGASADDKHEGGKPSDAPVGSMLCYKGAGPYGHIMLAAKDFGDGTKGAWSNDLVKYGQINKVARTAPTTHWGQKYLGFIREINGYDLDLTHQAPPKPKPKQVVYKGIGSAIEALDAALSTAKKQGDSSDIKRLQTEIAHLKLAYAELRRDA